MIDTYIIKDAKLLFKTEEGMLHEEKLDILVGVHDMDKLSEQERTFIIRLPSLLGRDIIRKFSFTFDEQEGLVLFEK